MDFVTHSQDDRARWEIALETLADRYAQYEVYDLDLAAGRALDQVREVANSRATQAEIVALMIGVRAGIAAR